MLETINDVSCESSMTCLISVSFSWHFESNLYLVGVKQNLVFRNIGNNYFCLHAVVFLYFLQAESFLCVWVLSILLGYVLCCPVTDAMDGAKWFIFIMSSFLKFTVVPLFCGIYMCSMKYTVPEVIMPVICSYLILSVPVWIYYTRTSLNLLVYFRETHLICCSPVAISKYLKYCAEQLFEFFPIILDPAFCKLILGDFFVVWFFLFMCPFWVFLVTPIFLYFRYWKVICCRGYTKFWFLSWQVNLLYNLRWSMHIFGFLVLNMSSFHFPSAF